MVRLRAAGCVFAEDEARLLRAAADGARLDELVEARVAGAPLEPLLGHVDFAGLRLRVMPGVFVPRQRSVFIARLAARAVASAASAAAAAVAAAGPAGAVGDVGDVAAAGAVAAGGVAAPAVGILREEARGSRPIVVEPYAGVAPLAAVVARAVPAARVVVSDVSTAALACARANVPGVLAVRGACLTALPHALRGRVEVIAAVPPYVPSGELSLLPREAREYEPTAALTAGADGLREHRALAAAATAWLAPGGVLLAELAAHQAREMLAFARGLGLSARAVDDPGSGTTVLRVKRTSG